MKTHTKQHRKLPVRKVKVGRKTYLEIDWDNLTAADWRLLKKESTKLCQEMLERLSGQFCG